MKYFVAALRPEGWALSDTTPEHFNIDFSQLEEGIYYYIVEVVEEVRSINAFRCHEWRLSKDKDFLFIDVLDNGSLISKPCFKNFTQLSENQYMR